MSTLPKTAVFPGSFDPFTRGHEDVMLRALDVFDRVVIAVAADRGAAPLFSLDERVDLIRAVCTPLGARVEVQKLHGLLVDFVRRQHSTIIVRGLRAISDFDYEVQMALMNKQLWDRAETLFLAAREENSYISSTAVKEIAAMGGDVGKFVPAEVSAALKQKFSR